MYYLWHLSQDVPSCPVHPLINSTKGTFRLRFCIWGWIQWLKCNLLWSIYYIWHLSQNVLSCPTLSVPPPPHRKYWSGHISASNQDRALMYCSYERSFKALSGFCSLVALVIIMSAKRSNKQEMTVLIDCQNIMKGDIASSTASLVGEDTEAGSASDMCTTTDISRSLPLERKALSEPWGLNCVWRFTALWFACDHFMLKQSSVANCLKPKDIHVWNHHNFTLPRPIPPPIKANTPHQGQCSHSYLNQHIPQAGNIQRQGYPGKTRNMHLGIHATQSQLSRAH